MNNYHIPVLLQEVLTYLRIKSGELYIDCTLGGGGHTLAILEHGGKVMGIDVDEDALTYVAEEIGSTRQELRERLLTMKGNFKDIDQFAKENDFENASGVLMDLGVSSHQFDEASRGFSFQEGPLDMRMDQELSVRAQDLINGLTEKELVELFERLGEERQARRIARVISERRKSQPITTTQELAELVRRSIHSSDKIHPATRVFQALRIAVNDELNVLREALPKAMSVLKPGGRLVVISFHSLEDRIVKQTFEQLSAEQIGKIITDKPVTPTEEEVLQNRRARSAKLRCIEKL